MLAWAVLLALLGRCCGRMVTFSEMQDDTVHIQEPPTTGPAGCADGSAFKFIVRKGTTNANRVLIDFMGGGACWGERCLETSSVQVQSLGGPESCFLVGRCPSDSAQMSEEVQTPTLAHGPT